ncbi:MAG TPA: hypothetical protein VEB40_08305 [Flavipsychrobacter sp.]|nr:hypothetical protein [Flavipsychrobacter sp.]
MKTLKFVIYLFHNYYSKGGTKRIPYFSALLATAFLVYIHIFQVLIILDKVHLLPMRMDNERIVNYLKFALFLSPIVIIISLLVKKQDVMEAAYSARKVKTGSILLLVYIIVNVVLLFVLAALIPAEQ